VFKKSSTTEKHKEPQRGKMNKETKLKESREEKYFNEWSDE
jgi:hypothetical protein